MPPKRAANTETGRRRSTRTSISHDQSGQNRQNGKNGVTSIYFDGEDSDLDMSDGAVILDGRKAKRAKTARARPIDSDSDGDDYKEDESEEQEADADEEAEEPEQAEDADDDVRPLKRSTPKAKAMPAKSAAARSRRKQESDDDDDDDDDDDTPKITFIPNKKLRDLGDVDVSDDTVHPVTLLFLKDLKANNRRTWLKENDGEFRRAQKDWLSFVETFGSRLAVDVDETIPELPAKDIVFRIYRDIRFSKDPSPYKPHFSAAWSRTGKKGPYAHYYIHCEPGACFVGAGMWHPDNDQLRLLRANIDAKPHWWRRVLVDDAVWETFFVPETKTKRKTAKTKDTALTDTACIKAFARLNAENALKKKPLGYAADHRDIELLKLRNFHIHKRVPDALFTAADAQDQLVALLKKLVPFVTHINRVVRPDPGDEDSEGNSSGGDEGDDEDGGDDDNDDNNDDKDA